MTQEEKQLLFKDLSARVPYKVKIKVRSNDIRTVRAVDVVEGIVHFVESDSISPFGVHIEQPMTFRQVVKPFLRPLSSITLEEIEDLAKSSGLDLTHRFADVNTLKTLFPVDIFHFSGVVDWLNAHHFDYRGLIEKGLALEAPDGMYNKEESEKGNEIPIPKTVDEAVKTLAKIISKEDRDYLLENGAISMHDSLGRWIRNEWGLWTGSELKDELMNMNKGLNHPDDMSNYIIEEFIKYWNNKL